MCQNAIRHSIDALVFIDPHPLDGVTTGETPDHHIAFPDAMLADLVSVGDVDGILCTVWIKVCPVGGLDCKGHVVFFVALIIYPMKRVMPIYVDSLLSGLPTL